MPGHDRAVRGGRMALADGEEKMHMRMLNVGLSMVVLAAVLFGGSVNAAERQGPRISVKEARFDLGRVDEGAQPEHIFEITNTGDDVLEIKQIQPT